MRGIVRTVHPPALMHETCGRKAHDAEVNFEEKGGAKEEFVVNANVDVLCLEKGGMRSEVRNLCALAG